MNDIAEILGRWTADLSLAAVPAAAQQAAMRCIIDVVGVTLAGSLTPLAGCVRDHVALQHAAGDCSVIGSASTSSALGAALANGAAAHVLDFDDTCYAGIVHGSAAVWPAVLAAGEAGKIDGGELIAAFVAGCEIEYAIGRVLGGGVYRWWTTAALGVIGAAAGAARALELDAEAAAHAIRLAACQSSGARAVFGTTAKPWLCGRAAQTGLDAALAARAGIGGPAGVFEKDGGFFALFGDGGDGSNGGVGADDFATLGERFSLVDPGIAFKLFPVCSAAQAAIEATVTLLAEHGIAGDQVERVRCEVTPFVQSCLMYARPRTVAEAQFSLQFAIGCILAYGRLDLDCLTAERLVDPHLEQAMAKVEMLPSRELFHAGEVSRDHLEAAIVTLHLADRRTVQLHVPAATGMPSNPVSDVRLREKFRDCATRALLGDAPEALLQRIASLRELPSITLLFS
jgi:2-methylcitrate dehydratase PrpD